MGVREATELVVIQQSVRPVGLAELFEGGSEAVEFLVVQQGKDLGVEASDDVMSHYDVTRARGTRLFWQAQDLVAVLLAHIIGDGEADDDPDTGLILELVPHALVRVDPVEACGEPGHKPGDIRLEAC